MKDDCCITQAAAGGLLALLPLAPKEGKNRVSIQGQAPKGRRQKKKKKRHVLGGVLELKKDSFEPHFGASAFAGKKKKLGPPGQADQRPRESGRETALNLENRMKREQAPRVFRWMSAAGCKKQFCGGGFPLAANAHTSGHHEKKNQVECLLQGPTVAGDLQRQ